MVSKPEEEDDLLRQLRRKVPARCGDQVKELSINDVVLGQLKKQALEGRPKAMKLMYDELDQYKRDEAAKRPRRAEHDPVLRPEGPIRHRTIDWDVLFGPGAARARQTSTGSAGQLTQEEDES
jgi:hypothetical protein